MGTCYGSQGDSHGIETNKMSKPETLILVCISYCTIFNVLAAFSLSDDLDNIKL